MTPCVVCVFRHAESAFENMLLDLPGFTLKSATKTVDCCVEAECHFCYLRDSSVYVYESWCLGNQRHPLTYVGRRRFWYGPLTKYDS
jgi:hypothetical protein